MRSASRPVRHKENVVQFGSNPSQSQGVTDAEVSVGAVIRRPDLHNNISCVHAPVTWTSPVSGQVRGGFDGLYVADRRAIELMVLTVNGAEPRPISAGLASAAEARFVGEVAIADDPASDPTLFCTRWRRATSDG